MLACDHVRGRASSKRRSPAAKPRYCAQGTGEATADLAVRRDRVAYALPGKRTHGHLDTLSGKTGDLDPVAFGVAYLHRVRIRRPIDRSRAGRCPALLFIAAVGTSPQATNIPPTGTRVNPPEGTRKRRPVDMEAYRGSRVIWEMGV